MKISEIFRCLDDVDYKIICDGEFETLELCTNVRKKNALTFLENIKYLSSLESLDISCVICTKNIVNNIPKNIEGIVISDNPKDCFYKIHNLLAKNDTKEKTVIGEECKICELSYISPNNVKIGKNVEIEQFVFIAENTVIEDNVKIHAGTVIGGQGFASIKIGQKAFLAKDRGSVLIEKGVEICSNCHIAKGTLVDDVTTLGEYSMLDAMVHIGHGTKVGKRVLIPAGATISGNCVIDDEAWIGVNATISNRIHIGKNSRVSLGSVVTKDVKDGETVSGNFAIEHKKFIVNLKKSVVEEIE